MRSKFFLLVSALVLSLVLGTCSGGAAVQSESESVNRNLSVTGTGTIFVAPDVAYIYIGVHTENKDISEAVGENNSKAQAVATALKGFGIEPKDIQTSNFSIWPSPQYDSEIGESTITYMVDNNVYVTVRDLPKLSAILEAAIQARANSINSIQFDLADKSGGQTEARQKAVTHATDLAEELADAANVTLGEIQTVSYYDSQSYPTYGYGMGGGGGGAADAVQAPIAPGQITISVSVTITYGLK